MSDPRKAPSWQALEEHVRGVRSLHMRDLFDKDSKRAERFSLRFKDLLFDYSKNRITEDTLPLLLDLAVEADVPGGIARMFAGEAINSTEQRAAFHVALRHPGDAPMRVAGDDVMPAVGSVLKKMKTFSERLQSGDWRGHTGQTIRDVVNIGIGGSDLGPAMVTEALRPYWRQGMRAHFVSNVDAAHLLKILEGIDPERTLFIVASKSFKTQETLLNARSARDWLLHTLDDERAVARHFVAISSNAQAVAEFGIDPENMFEFWDWVGGRFSLWSAIGLSIACVIGMERFEELLLGAHEMDQHFATSELPENIPVLMALLGIWYRNFLSCSAHAVLPYDQSLNRLPAFLQQLEMESNGKRVRSNGERVATYATVPVIFGEPGTNAQHAFFQMLHQGTDIVPCDFIVAMKSQHPLDQHHQLLVANCFAQSEALMRGRTHEEAEAQLKEAGLSSEEIKALVEHKVFPGNRPSNTLAFKRLTPKNLGRLIALYEHKTFVQGLIWRTNSFDQWGVELGKELASRIVPSLSDEVKSGAHDSSTEQLIDYYQRNQS